ncbi:hypothetical protein F2Q69_00031748 [Brassica cretica]|uniref:Rab proteins geranylgeranyltransferase component n=1 Tax=Brassica cretica TaxID=69181 RepID=A0A8S9RX24_BRACR|nr:hypothetical protein F2Q69_00031748 [Brassica cretica]
MSDLPPYPPLDPTTYDLIIVGTGVSESILSAAASSSGSSVLHLDPNPFYGSHSASLSLPDLTSFLHSPLLRRRQTIPTSSPSISPTDPYTPPSRKFNVDLCASVDEVLQAHLAAASSVAVKITEEDMESPLVEFLAKMRLPPKINEILRVVDDLTMIKTMWKSTQDQRGDSSIGFVHYIYWQRGETQIEDVSSAFSAETEDRRRLSDSVVESRPTCLVFSIKSRIETEDQRRLSGSSQRFLRLLRRNRLLKPRTTLLVLTESRRTSLVFSVRSRIETEDRRRLSGSSRRFLLLHVRVDDSVHVDGVSSVGLSALANDLFNVEISSQLFTSFSFQFMNACSLTLMKACYDCVIKDRNRRPTTSLWLLTEISPPSPPKPTIETEDDSVGPHGVSSHFSRLLRQIKDRNRRPTTSLWLLTEIPPPSPPKPTIETEDDSVGPHGVSSHFSRLLRQIKDRNRRPTTSLWLLTEIPLPSPPKPTIETRTTLLVLTESRRTSLVFSVRSRIKTEDRRHLSGSSRRFLLLHVRVDDFVRVDGDSTVGLSALANNLFNVEISSQLFKSFSFQFMNACDSS